MIASVPVHVMQVRGVLVFVLDSVVMMAVRMLAGNRRIVVMFVVTVVVPM